jgi:hypothetical protein
MAFAEILGLKKGRAVRFGIEGLADVRILEAILRSQDRSG